MSAHEIMSVFNDFDADGSGGIDFVEFLDLIQTLMRKQHPTQEEVLTILQCKPAARKPAELVRLSRCPLLLKNTQSTYKHPDQSSTSAVLSATCVVNRDGNAIGPLITRLLNETRSLLLFGANCTVTYLSLIHI